MKLYGGCQSSARGGANGLQFGSGAGVAGGVGQHRHFGLDAELRGGAGRTDRDVGQLLGISGQTVHQHIEEAKRRYNVATRQQLIVRALFDAQITFADLIN